MKDSVYNVTLQPLNTSNNFAPSHGLRIEVSSTSFPRFDRNVITTSLPSPLRALL